jgi:hypothetical protein
VLSTEYVVAAALTVALFFCLLHDNPARAAAPLDSYPAELEALAAKCEELGLTDQAVITRSWIVPRHAGRTYLFLQDVDSIAAPKADAPERVKQWFGKFERLRAEQAERLFAEARQAAQVGDAAKAYRLLWETLREQPEHAEARRILSEAKRPIARTPLAGKAEHPVMGWNRGRYWQLETAHFQIAFNKRGLNVAKVAVELEELHAIWRQLFFDYWANPASLRQRFAGENAVLEQPGGVRPHKVVLFASREEFHAALVKLVPKIAMTTGYYDPKLQTAFFYLDDQPKTVATYRHEATHQLFQESIRTAKEPAQAANAWILEGIAMYLESLQKQGSYYTLGGWEAERLQFARYRALAGDFAMPLAELATLDREALQAHADIRKLYSHSAGLAQFLMDGEGGRYREIVRKYLAAIYRGEDEAGTLPKLLKSDGHTLAGIDAEYRRFLNVTDEDLAATPSPERLRTISLGRTSVTDQGLAALAGCKSLEWLDLSGTKTTDAGFAHFAGNTKLTQLFLDGVPLTDASLPLVAKFKELEELDLSNTGITDAGLGSLAGLRKLKILYLTGTNLTDKSLPVLKGLKSLDTLDLQGTKISSEASAELRRALPKATVQ